MLCCVFKLGGLKARMYFLLITCSLPLGFRGALWPLLLFFFKPLINNIPSQQHFETQSSSINTVLSNEVFKFYLGSPSRDRSGYSVCGLVYWVPQNKKTSSLPPRCLASQGDRSVHAINMLPKKVLSWDLVVNPLVMVTEEEGRISSGQNKEVPRSG